MKKNYALIIVVLLLFGCQQDEKATDIFLDEVTFGAVLRTVSFNNSQFTIDDPNSVFSVNLEEQDEGDGAAMEKVDIYVQFKDNTLTGAGDFSTNEVHVKTLSPDDFAQGPNGLPRTTLELSYSELMNATQVSHSSISCKDQFLIRLELTLADGRVFSVDNSSAIVIAFQSFFGSPFCYTINIIEPIDEDLFTGFYFYRSVEDGPLGPTFGPPRLVEIKKGHSNSVRVVALKHVLSHPTNELPKDYEFSIVCDEVVMEKNQLSGVNGKCLAVANSPLLMGPGDENAPINLDDDGVFELWFVEAYNGWDGLCGFDSVPSKIQFTKQ